MTGFVLCLSSHAWKRLAPVLCLPECLCLEVHGKADSSDSETNAPLKRYFKTPCMIHRESHRPGCWPSPVNLMDRGFLGQITQNMTAATPTLQCARLRCHERTVLAVESDILLTQGDVTDLRRYSRRSRLGAVAMSWKSLFGPTSC